MLYYIPAVHQPTPERIETAGLSYAFEGKPLAAPVTRGPCGGPGGVILCDPQAAGSNRLGYYEHEQTWRKVPGAKSMTEHGSVCVGTWNDPALRPTPEQLARRSQLNGHLCELADHRQWNCPVALRWCDSDPITFVPALPRGVELDDDGEWVTGDFLPDYRHLWTIAERWQTFYASLAGDEDEDQEDGEITTSLALSDIFDDAVDCLAVNYRVRAVECAMLGLLSELSAGRVLNALIDDPGLAEILQKKTGD